MSGFTSVLKKVGQVLLKTGAAATEIMQMPFVSNVLTGAAGALGTKIGIGIQAGISDFNSVASILGLMETAFPGTGTGSQKLNAATPAVGQIVLAWAESNLSGHNKLKVDPALFEQHVKAFTSSFADVMNDFGD